MIAAGGLAIVDRMAFISMIVDENRFHKLLVASWWCTCCILYLEPSLKKASRGVIQAERAALARDTCVLDLSIFSV